MFRRRRVHSKENYFGQLPFSLHYIKATVYCFSPYDGIHWELLSKVSSDVERLRRKEGKIGLHLNVDRCEVIFKDPFKPEGSLAGFSMLPSDAILLGAPLVDLGLVADRALKAGCLELRKAINRLKTICAMMLQFCFGLLLVPLDFAHPPMYTM